MTRDARRVRDSLARLISMQEANGDAASELENERRQLLSRGTLIVRASRVSGPAGRLRSRTEEGGIR